MRVKNICLTGGLSGGRSAEGGWSAHPFAENAKGWGTRCCGSNTFIAAVKPLRHPKACDNEACDSKACDNDFLEAV
jgi:hypothetical protein